ncbi:MAG: hypothetical protein OXH52_12040 [Gammaproteobacteria bacterium]|nr:hypothetical protein [Gammaproteobacteria bacterium]
MIRSARLDATAAVVSHVARDVVSARMLTTDGIVGQHNIPHVLTGVKAAALPCPPPQAAAALTPAPLALQTGSYPTMPDHDRATPRPASRLHRSPTPSVGDGKRAELESRDSTERAWN